MVIAAEPSPSVKSLMFSVKLAVFDCAEFVPVTCTVYVPCGVVAAMEVMVAVTLVPPELAAGFTFDSVQLVPAGAPTIAQPSATFPVKPFSPFTTMVSLMFVPT